MAASRTRTNGRTTGTDGPLDRPAGPLRTQQADDISDLRTESDPGLADRCARRDCRTRRVDAIATVCSCTPSPCDFVAQSGGGRRIYDPRPRACTRFDRWSVLREIA